VKPAYLECDEDRAAVAAGLALVERLATTPAMSRFVDGPFVLEDAATVAARGLTPYHHFVGTCRVGSQDDPGAVVNSDGRVFGTDGLWIADASVIPTIPRANVILSVIAVAEGVAEAIQARLEA